MLEQRTTNKKRSKEITIPTKCIINNNKIKRTENYKTKQLRKTADHLINTRCKHSLK